MNSTAREKIETKVWKSEYAENDWKFMDAKFKQKYEKQYSRKERMA